MNKPERQKGRLTVIIPSYNGRDLLRACLRSLQKQTRSCSVLVVDDGSKDQTAQMVEQEFAPFECLPSPRNEGFARAVNRGLRHCRTEFAALLNNDTEADPGWVQAGLNAFRQHPEYWFFASRLIQYHDRSRLDGAGDCYGRSGLPLKRGHDRPVTEKEFLRDRPVLGASAGAAFYRMALFDEIGEFDEGYSMYLEDVDFSLRSQLAGRPCLYLHQAVVHHMEAASDPQRSPDWDGNEGERAKRTSSVYYSPARVYWITRNRWQLMWTYQPLRHAPWLLCGWVKSALFHLLKAGYLYDFLRGTIAGWRCLPRAWRKRKRLSRTRRIDKGQLCRLLRRC